MKIKKGTIKQAMELEKQIPEFDKPYSEEKYNNKLTNSYNLILIAYVDEKPAGFKVGYELDKKTFYSWIGGVIPEFRNQKIAKKLLEKQEKIIKEKKYSKIRVKSTNGFPNMLKFLISSNYKIIDYIEKEDVMRNKIVFEKEL